MDFDADGDVDCILGQFDGSIWYLRNDGINTVTRLQSFTKWDKDNNNNPFHGVDVGYWAYPTCRDMDNDSGDNKPQHFHTRHTSPTLRAGDVFLTSLLPILDIDCFIGTGVGTIAYFEK